MLSHAPASLLVKEAMEAGDSEPHDVGEVRSVVAGVFDAAVRDGMGRRAEPLPMPMRRLTSSPGMQPSAPRAGPRCTTRLSPSCAWGRCAAVVHEATLLFGAAMAHGQACCGQRFKKLQHNGLQGGVATSKCRCTAAEALKQHVECLKDERLR